MSEIKFGELEGKGVLTQDGREVGAVDDIVIDYEAWTVRTLVVKLERELLEQFHMKKPMFGTQTIQIPVSYVSGVSDKVILQKKLEELTAAAREKAADQDDSAEEEEA
jgi:sporulation protein YlmC with PRC-barrel domain